MAEPHNLVGKTNPGWDNVRVWLNGDELSPAHSLSVMNHSPDGFSWGYNGSGPSQLALAVCLAMGFKEHRVLIWYHNFRDQVIAELPMEKNFDIRFWLTHEGWVYEHVS